MAEGGWRGRADRLGGAGSNQDLHPQCVRGRGLPGSLSRKDRHAGEKPEIVHAGQRALWAGEPCGEQRLPFEGGPQGGAAGRGGPGGGRVPRGPSRLEKEPVVGP